MINISSKRHSDSLFDWISSLREFQLDGFFDTRSLGRAYEYVAKLEDIVIEENRISASIHGTAKYDIQIIDNGDHVSINCSCPMNTSCKHIAALMISQMDIEY